MSEDICALVRDPLLALCDAYTAKSRERDDPFGDDTRTRLGLQTCRAILESAPFGPSLTDYAFTLHRLMAAEWAAAVEANDEDANHGRAAGIRMILDEVEAFIAVPAPAPVPPPREPDRANLLTLFESQLPLVRARHANASLEPLSAFMDPDGTIHGEALDDAINPCIRRHLSSLRDGSIQAGGVFFHASVSDDGISPTRSSREPNAIVGRLANSEGAAMQALVRYRAGTVDGLTIWSYDEPQIVAIPALHLIATLRLVSISAERPDGFHWSAEPLRPVSADGTIGMTTNGQGNAMVWRMSDQHPLCLLEGDGPDILACALTANGDVAATSAADGVVILWDVARAIRIANLSLDIAHTEVAFSADGDHLALLASDDQYSCFRVF